MRRRRIARLCGGAPPHSAASACAQGVVRAGRQEATHKTLLVTDCRPRCVVHSQNKPPVLQGAALQPSSRLWRFQSSTECAAQQ
jgi:hypothetical protein